MNVRVNVRLLILLLLLTGGLALGVHFLHAYQTPRNAQALLDQANRAEEKGEPAQAARFLGRYLRLAPQDVDTRVRFGRLLDKQVAAGRGKEKVIEVFEQVLLHDPERHDIRRRLAELAVEIGLIDEALAHLRILQETFPNDADVLYQLGRCHEYRAQYAQAAALYEKAVQYAPQHVESYHRRALLLRLRLENPAAADALMDQLVKVNPQSVPARLMRWRYLREAGKPDAGAEDVQAALQLAPDQADVRLAAAERAQGKGEVEEARRHLEEGLAKNPKHVRLFQVLAGLELRQGRPQEAVAVLRRALAAVPRQPDLTLHLADLLIDGGDLDGARAVREDMRQIDTSTFRLMYVDARLNLRDRKFAEAAALLEKIRPQAADEPAFTVQLDLLLGQCYEALGDGDKQIAVYRRVLTVEPAHVQARQGLAAALVSQGRLDEALAEYQRLMSLSRAPAQGWVPLAQLMILRNLQQPEGQRQWQPVERVLDLAAKTLPDSVVTPVLRAEVRVAQNKLSEARQVLEKAREQHPKHSAPWLALAALAQREKQPARAEALLDEAEKKLGDRLEFRQARLQQAAGRGGAEALTTVAALEQGRERFPPDERAQLLTSLGQAYSLLGKPAEARRLWRELVELQPGSVTPHTLLFDLALQAQDQEGMKQALDALLKVEGPNGVAWQWGEVCRRVLLAQQGDKDQLPEIKKHLAAVTARRPNWPRVVLYRAYVDELEGNPQAALENYQRAIDLGERQPETIRRAAQLLNARHRFAEADALLRKLSDAKLLTGDLQRVSAEAALRNVDHARALELARKAVPPDSKDPHDHIWLGQVLFATGRKAEAETALRRALELNPKTAETWAALVLFHFHTEQPQEAEALLEKAQKECPQKAPLAWAQCYEVLRQPERAEKLYRAALAERPTDQGVMRAVADFLVRTGRRDEAQVLLRRMLGPGLKATPAEAAWARRNLALLLMDGDFPQYRQAVALMEENLKAPGGTPEDQRVRAVVLAAQPQGRRQAIEILEGLYRRIPPTPDQQYFLAQLHDAGRNWPQARQWLLGALAVQGDNPLYLATYVRGLLVEGAANDAEQWLVRLEKVAPHVFETANLRVRLLAAQGKAAEAVALLRNWIAAKESLPAETPARLLLAAVLLEELGHRHVDHRRVLDPPAEEFYRKNVSGSGEPTAVLPLIRYLARRQRVAEGLDLCEAAWKTCPPEAAGEVALNLLHAAPPSPEQVERVERWLRAALDKTPQSLPLLLCLADLRDSIQGRYAEAEAVYAQVLALESDNLVALNNLAYLLAIKGQQTQRALQFIERALALRGPAAELLDTRGVVYLALGQNEQALKDLEAAAAALPNSTMYFHLAQAHWQGRNRTAAAEAWKKAKSAGLDVAALHPIERETYRKLQSELEVR